MHDKLFRFHVTAGSIPRHYTDFSAEKRLAVALQ